MTSDSSLLSREEARKITEVILKETNTSLSSLSKQAKEGRWENDACRRAWFFLSGLGLLDN